MTIIPGETTQKRRDITSFGSHFQESLIHCTEGEFGRPDHITEDRRQNGAAKKEEAQGKMEPPQVVGFQVCLTQSPNSSQRFIQIFNL